MSYRRDPPDTRGMVSLKVDNLTYRTTMDDLRRVFEKYGEVGDIYIPRDRFTRESRGFAFVRYYDKRDADDAIESLDATDLDGREIRVQTARYGLPTDGYRRAPRGRRGGGYSYGRGGGGGGYGYGGGSSGYRSSYRRRSRSRSRSRDRRRRRSYSRSRSSSRSRPSSSRSRSRSPKYRRRSSPRPSRSPRPARSHSRSRSKEKSRSRSRSAS